MEMNEFFEKELLNDKELKKEYDLLENKYKLIDELIAYRKNNNLTQKEFAEKISVNQQEISRFEKGEIDPKSSFVKK